MPQPDPAPRDEPARPRRRWFQYGLRTLLVLTTLVAVSLAWWSHKARRQREAVAALRAAGWNVYYDFEFCDADVREVSRPPQWPKWLVDALGVDYFATVEKVVLIDGKVNDARLDRLKGLTALCRVAIHGTPLTDSGLEHLKDLTGLTTLALRNTQITDAGVQRLQQALPNCTISRRSWSPQPRRFVPEGLPILAQRFIAGYASPDLFVSVPSAAGAGGGRNGK